MILRSGFHNALTRPEPPEIDLSLDMAFVDGVFNAAEQGRPDNHRFISRRQRGSEDEDLCLDCGQTEGNHTEQCMV